MVWKYLFSVAEHQFVCYIPWEDFRKTIMNKMKKVGNLLKDPNYSKNDENYFGKF